MLNTDYKLRHSSPWNWQDFDTVRLEISVGQDYHEGEKLKTAAAWARQNFSRAVLIVGDRIQGYNLSIVEGLSLAVAFGRATRKGDEWLERNQEAIKGMEITRWHDWLSNPAYPANRAAVDALYDNNLRFRDHIDNTVEGFWWRRNAPTGFNERFKKLSREFLLEETAVFATSYKELGGISAYPGSFLETWEMFVNESIDGAPEGLKNAHWMRLQFRRRPQGMEANAA